MPKICNITPILIHNSKKKNPYFFPGLTKMFFSMFCLCQASRLKTDTVLFCIRRVMFSCGHVPSIFTFKFVWMFHSWLPNFAIGSLTFLKNSFSSTLCIKETHLSCCLLYRSVSSLQFACLTLLMTLIAMQKKLNLSKSDTSVTSFMTSWLYMV